VTGSFGSAFIERCLSLKVKEIRVFSRDERKQFNMM
jgi:FlaA1/EpsC-like NDP-sugar epimerase